MTLIFVDEQDKKKKIMIKESDNVSTEGRRQTYGSPDEIVIGHNRYIYESQLSSVHNRKSSIASPDNFCHTAVSYDEDIELKLIRVFQMFE